MPVNDQLGMRMKTYYEAIPKTKLMRRTPVAIRIDGKAFHTFTRGFQKPFDKVLIAAMQNTMRYLCENVQGAVLGYCQSDEITLILQDYATFTTDAWFDYEVQKMCSIAASMATMVFNKCFEKEISDYCNNISRDEDGCLDPEQYEQWKKYIAALGKGAMFDARCFNIPKEEVCNLIYWRQLDATRNSIQMVGQANFSQTELNGKSCNEIQDMLMTQKGINWNDFPTYLKRGSACIRMPISEEKITEIIKPEWGEPRTIEKMVRRYAWTIDLDMPILKGDGRSYVEDWIYIGE